MIDSYISIHQGPYHLLVTGDGIKISEDIEELLDHVDSEDTAFVIQRYIDNPFLLEGGRKFDIRYSLLSPKYCSRQDIGQEW